MFDDLSEPKNYKDCKVALQFTLQKHFKGYHSKALEGCNKLTTSGKDYNSTPIQHKFNSNLTLLLSIDAAAAKP